MIKLLKCFNDTVNGNQYLINYVAFLDLKLYSFLRWNLVGIQEGSIQFSVRQER